MLETPFVHLHNHTEYSLLDGACKVDKMVELASKMGMPAVAMTDHGNMFGAIHFYKSCKANNIKPIIGQEFYIAENSRHVKEKENRIFHLVLLAMNNRGYQNIMKLSSLAYTEGFYKKPRIDKEILSQYNEGIIALSACIGGEIPVYVADTLKDSDKEKELKTRLGEYIDIFGHDRFYLELMDHGMKEEKLVNPYLINLSKTYGLETAVTNDNHFLLKEDYRLHDVMLAIQTQSLLSDNKRFRFSSDQFYFKPYEEMKLLFPELPQAYSNTVAIAEQCDVSIQFGNFYLPEYIVPDGFTQSSYLRKTAMEGLYKKYSNVDQVIQDRFNYEFEVVEKMGFIGYFLIVWDIIKWSKEQGIFIGPGRGSAGGSILAYALDITDIDPLKYNLLFERFLNPDRISMPDIDIDVQDTKREIVINHLKEKYGEDHVAYIAALGQLKAKNAIRDTARTLEFSASESLYITKIIQGDNLEKEYLENENFQKLIESEERMQTLFEHSKYLEGQYRQTSLHAAGIVIAPSPVSDLVPLFLADTQKNIIATQYEKNALEQLGILKMDFLGLKNLTIIEEAFKLIKQRYGKEYTLQDIPLDDPKTYSIFQTGNTNGCFQIESTGMKKLLKRLVADNIDEIIAVLALYRPGPIESGYLDLYIERKHDPSKIEYPFDVLEPILKETYGVIVYQEQIMKTAMTLSGFTGGEADVLRKAIGKKQGSLIEKMKQKFVQGAIDKGFQKEKVEDLYQNIENFAKYCFNKSHSAAYAYITIYTGFLKANYTIEYMTALLRAWKDEIDKVALYIEDTKLQGIKILSPDINRSEVDFSIEGKNIRFGLSAIKGVGEQAAENITEERKANGKYLSFMDFCKRVNKNKVNKRIIETLVTVGAFDFTKHPRELLLSMTEELTGYCNSASNSGSNLFEDQAEDMEQQFFNNLVKKHGKIYEKWEEKKFFDVQLEFLGDFITKSPFDGFMNEIYYYNDQDFESLKFEGKDQDELFIIGYIQGFDKRKSKKDGKDFYILTVNYYFDKFKCFLFQFDENEIASLLNNFYQVYAFKIMLKKAPYQTEGLFTIQAIIPGDQIPRSPLKSIELLLKKDFTDHDLAEIKQILSTHSGETSIRFSIQDQPGKFYLENNKFNSAFVEKLEKVNSIANIIKEELYQ